MLLFKATTCVSYFSPYIIASDYEDAREKAEAAVKQVVSMRDNDTQPWVTNVQLVADSENQSVNNFKLLV